MTMIREIGYEQDFCDSRKDVSEEIETNVGTFFYYSEPRMESWYGYDTCEWRWIKERTFCGGGKT